jgi:hypothetical protein
MHNITSNGRDAQSVDWPTVLFRYKGWKMKVQIADASAQHQTQVRYQTLEQVKQSEESELRFYFNELQFLAVPLFDNGDTKHTNTMDGGRFTSHDRSRDLIYTIDFYQ